jgi:uncharacterized protein (TIGR02246 family)
MTNDEHAIRDLISTWMRASEEGDATTILSLMADDVVFLVAGQKPFGKEEFAASQKGLARQRMSATSEIREIKILGDWAFCWTHLAVMMTPPDGAPVRRSGHTLSIFNRLDDGRWVLARDANMLTLES